MLTHDQAILAFINEARSLRELPTISTLPETCQQLAEAIGALDVARDCYCCPHFTAGFETAESAELFKELWDTRYMAKHFHRQAHIPHNRVALPLFLAGFVASEISIPLY